MFADFSHIPAPGEKRIAVRLKPTAERQVRHGHPWVYDESIVKLGHAGNPGDLAVIFDKRRKFLAIGLYDPQSPIRIRILHQGRPERIDGRWWRYQLEKAAEQRAPLRKTNTTGYRLVHGENDGFSGLVIDRYQASYVLKLYSIAWLPHLPDVLAALVDVAQPENVVLRLSRHVAEALQTWPAGRREPLCTDGQLIYGKKLENPVRFLENGLYFEADLIAGQKTGFFLDQRENRARVERLAAGKTVLNLFAYTGGFSLYAARGGAREVVSADLSQPALAGALRNFRLNAAQPQVAAAAHELLVGDAFRTLAHLQETKRQFDLVIIDPPAFAKRGAEVARATAAYARLARLGTAVLRRGGTLVFASCSSRVPAELFFETVLAAAEGAGRPLAVLETTAHALDHPITFPEAAYLKCLFAQLEA